MWPSVGSNMAHQPVTISLRERERRALFRSHAHLTDTRRFVGPTSPESRARSSLGLLPAIAFAILAFLAVSALETFSINPERPAAILFPDGISEERAFAALVAAGGLPIRPGRSVLSDGVVWIAAADTSDFFDRVKSFGAWAVINPFAFGGCFLVTPL